MTKMAGPAIQRTGGIDARRFGEITDGGVIPRSSSSMVLSRASSSVAAATTPGAEAGKTVGPASTFLVERDSSCGGKGARHPFGGTTAGGCHVIRTRRSLSYSNFRFGLSNRNFAE